MTSFKLGSQDAIVGGGRYDGLISSLGGPDIPSFGWALGMERLSLLMEESPLMITFSILHGWGKNV